VLAIRAAARKASMVSLFDVMFYFFIRYQVVIAIISKFLIIISNFSIIHIINNMTAAAAILFVF
jgi:hypothetical protein